MTKPDGSTCELCMWLAATEAERERGLMFVTDLGGYDGMVFRYEEPTTGGYWMKNTVMPLTIAYVDRDGAVLNSLDMEPCAPDATQCEIYRPAGAFVTAIEVEQGRLDELGFVEGVIIALGGACTRAGT